ncbi:hypothetical protein OAA22_00465 [bacterium]|nr:hypothetical protein [bacterium]
MAKTFKEYLKEISDQQMKDMSKGNAYGGSGKGGDKQNNRPRPKPLTQEEKDALRAKRSAEYEADLKKKRAENAARLKSYGESTNEEVEVTDEMNGMISDWIEKFSRFIGGNGDTLPDGYIQWALNSGITTDFVEQNEAEAMREKYGEDEFENDPLGHVDEMPITKAALEMIEKITGNDDIDTNARMIDKVQSGDADEPNTIKVRPGDADESTVELDRIKELAGASIDETYDDDDAFYEAYGELWYNEDDIIDEAEYQGRKVKLGKPMQGDVKKFKVYVKDPKTGNVKKVNFGHGGSSVKGKAMSIKKNNPKRRKSFRARHNCDNPGPRTKARYWSCRKW